MKLFLLAFFAVVAVSAEEDYSAPEWRSIDWSKVISPFEVPGVWENTVFAQLMPKPNRNRRIIGGQIVVPHTHPYQVGQYQDMIIYVTLCGGSLISPTVVLTAAHCAVNTVSTLVITGAHNIELIEPNQQRRTVPLANYRIHANFNPETLNNDVTTLILSTPLTLNTFVATIPLAQAGAGTFVGVTAQATGWGDINDYGDSSSELRYVTAPIITNAACADVFGDEAVNDSKMCISTVGGGGTCSGDSGGPLTVVQGAGRLQVGITSFSDREGCTLGYPAGFERVSAQIGWIAAHMS